MLDDPIQARPPNEPSADLLNEDLAPVAPAQRTFTTYDIAALWIGLVVCVPAYTLAGSVIDLGMSAAQGIACIAIANLIVLLPMVLNGHAGCKYGVPFPVLARSAFGIKGANVPAVMRALVGCGWFGIQTHVGGQAIFAIACAALKLSTAAVATAHLVPALGISSYELLCYATFWAAQVAVVVKGIESIRVVEKYAAPVLIVLCVSLFVWAYAAAGGLGAMLSTPSAFVAGGPKEGQFLSVFLPMITAVVGFWATLSLNISDFTRYATSQKAQFKGQTIGLPFFMAAFSFMSVAITSCSAVIFGSAVADPVALLAKADGGPLTTAVAMGGLLVATLSTNIAANIVAPANAFVNLAPSKLSFRAGGIATAVLGTAILPWRLMADASGYIFVWLIGYSALLGPIAGIMIADYFLVRRRVLDVDALYKSGEGTAYWYEGGFNTRAMWAFAAGVAPNVPGFALSAGIVPAAAAQSLRASFPGALRTFELVYGYAWFVGFFVGAGLYLALMRGESHAGENEEVLYTA